jgi:hypothetical protein
MRRKHPPAEMLAELQQTFRKFNWSGKPVGLVPNANAGEQGQCPPGQTPHQITYQLPDGTWVTKTVCI